MLPDVFRSLTSSIVEHQISNSALATVGGRSVALFSDVTSQNIQNINVADIQKCGIKHHSVLNTYRVIENNGVADNGKYNTATEAETIVLAI